MRRDSMPVDKDFCAAVKTCMSLEKILFLLICFLGIAPVTFAHEKPAGVEGRIRTADRNAAAYVTVQLVEVKKTTARDEEGYFSFKNFTPGRYTLTVTLVGYEHITGVVIV